MKIGIQLYLGGESATPEFISAAMSAIESGGFHAVWLAEHIALPPKITSPYPYSEDGSFPFDPSLLPLEPLTTLSFISAYTRKIRLATGVSVLPQRNPIFAAKQVADVDVLSGGRVDYGIGAGWCLEEIAALGVPIERRGARTDDYIRLIKKLWTQETVSHDSEFIKLTDTYTGPKPFQKPHPPIYVGGNSKAALRRVACLANGWFAAALTPVAYKSSIENLKNICDVEGRFFEEIDLVVGPPSGKATLDTIQEYRDVGASQVVVALSGRNLDKFLNRIEDMAEHLVRPAASF